MGGRAGGLEHFSMHPINVLSGCFFIRTEASMPFNCLTARRNDQRLRVNTTMSSMDRT